MTYKNILDILLYIHIKKTMKTKNKAKYCCEWIGKVLPSTLFMHYFLFRESLLEKVTFDIRPEGGTEVSQLGV